MALSFSTFAEENKSLPNNNTRPPQKPNIIYILADDMGYGDLSCYGQERFQIPNIDRIAREGIREWLVPFLPMYEKPIH